MTTSGIPDRRFDDELGPLWNWALRAIGVMATVLAALFAWVQLREIPLPPIESVEPTYVRRIVLAIYYACWVAGSTVDANIQKEVYRRDPVQGKIPREALLAVVGLFVVAVLLLWASDSDQSVSLALVPFLIVNVVGWRVLVRRVSPIITATAQAYEQAEHYHRLEQLGVVDRYMRGRWQWLRFGVLALLVAGTNVMAFSPPVRAWVASYVGAFFPASTSNAIAGLLPVAALVLFVLVSEGWIWVLRLRNAVALRTIADLATRYSLKPIGRPA
jgi:hypothetical protein